MLTSIFLVCLFFVRDYREEEASMTAGLLGVERRRQTIMGNMRDRILDSKLNNFFANVANLMRWIGCMFREIG